MRIRRNPYDPAVDLILPHIEGDTIVISEWPRSHVLVNTSAFVACNHVNSYGNFTYYFFVSGPKEVDWGDLSDDQRIMFRMPRTCEHGKVSFMRPEFPYEDSRYYILEALT